MNDDAVRVRQIDFSAAVPSLHLLKTIPLAFSVQCFVPALLASIIWTAFSRLFSQDAPLPPGRLLSQILPDPVDVALRDAYHLLSSGASAGWLIPARLLLTLLILNFAAVAITRASGVQFCSDRRTGAVRAMRHAARQWKSVCVSTALILLLGVISLCLFRIGSQLCVSLCNVAGAASVSQIVLWLLAAVLLLATGITGTGWLLSTASIGVDSCDGAEALSRGISYVLSLFWRCGCYGLVILLMVWFSQLAITFLLNLAASATTQSIVALQVPPADSSLFMTVTTVVQEAIKLSGFFSGISIAYVLLRRLEDNIGFRETDSGAHGLN